MDTNEVVRGQVQRPALVAAAMIAGIVMFVVVILVVGPVGDGDSGMTQLFYLLMAAVAAGGILVSTIAHRYALWQGRRAWREAGDDVTAAREALSQAVTTWFVVPCAACEALGLLAAVSFMITGAWPALLVVAAAVALIVLRFPTRARIEDILRKLREPPA